MASIRVGNQQDLVTLACYSTENAQLIRNTIPADLYEGIYQEVIEKVYAYIDKYDGPPCDHLADLLHEELNSDDKRKANTYEDLVLNIKENSRTINPKFAIDEATTFVKRQKIKQAVIEAAELLQNNNDDLEVIEQTLVSAVNARMESFDAGTFLSDADRSLAYLNDDSEYMPTGIPELDKYNVSPVRGGMWLFLAAAKRGKTQLLAFIAKACLMQRYKILHITLEMSEAKIAKRYHQTLFAMGLRKEDIEINRVKSDNKGQMVGISPDVITPKITLEDPNIESKLKRKIKSLDRTLKNLLVKQFPTGTLTVKQLKVYLDSIEKSSFFKPDLVILDYPDLMGIESGDQTQHRHKLSRLMIELRGLAAERNFALAVVSQINRSGAEKKLATETSVSEDWSKIANADTVIVYNQTQAERDLSLARLYVAAAREDMDKFTVIVSQAYGVGQFRVASAMLKNNKKYDDLVKAMSGASDEEDDDE